jgi:hypothetical protein
MTEFAGVTTHQKRQLQLVFPSAHQPHAFGIVGEHPEDVPCGRADMWTQATR